MTKRIVDLLLTIALLLMMSYSLIGEAVHEWIRVLHALMSSVWAVRLTPAGAVICIRPTTL